MPPKVLNKDSCRGCGSNIHKTACCPNRPCPCCFNYHSRGILDCPITKAVLERQHKAAAAGAKAAKKAVRQQARAANLAAYTALLPFGVVESNKSLFTASNWGLVGNDTCPTCGWLPKGCFCSV